MNTPKYGIIQRLPDKILASAALFHAFFAPSSGDLILLAGKERG